MLLIAFMLTACSGPVAATAPGPAPAGIPLQPVALPRPSAVSIQGVVTLPSGIVAGGGGNIVAGGGGNIVAGGGGNIVAGGGGNYTIQKTGAAGRHLLDVAGRPLAGGEVYLADASGKQIAGLPRTRTDERGHYEIPDVPVGFTFVVVCTAKTHDGKDVQFQTIATTQLGLSQTDAHITIASTLVAIGVVEGRIGEMGLVDNGDFRDAVAALAKAITDADLPDVADIRAVLAKSREKIAEGGEVQDLVTKLRGQAADVKSTADDLRSAIAATNPNPAAPQGDLPPAAAESRPTAPESQPDRVDLPPAAPDIVTRAIPPSGNDDAPRPGSQEGATEDIRSGNDGGSGSGSQGASKDSLLGDLIVESITSSGFAIRHVAGSSTGGSVVGVNAVTTTFQEISGIAIGGTGTLYVADAGSNRLVAVPATETATVVAGTASVGASADGILATLASLDRPRGLVRDLNGVLIFCDSGSNRVRRVSADGHIFTDAGGGHDTGLTVANARDALLGRPWGIAADHNGNVYFTESDAGRVRRLSPGGRLTTVATFPSGSPGAITLDRRHGVLWVGNGSQVKAIIGVDSAVPTLVESPVFTASGTFVPVITGLACDQNGVLYASQTSTPPDGVPNSADSKIWRIPVSNLGHLVAGRSAEVVAGTGGSSPSDIEYAFAGINETPATSRLLAGTNWCALTVDESLSSSTTIAGGSLYAGNSYFGRWGQVVRLTPNGLNPP